MFDFLNMMNNKEERQVDNTTLDGDTTIDTCQVSDGRQPYETGIQSRKYNMGMWVIVEAYDTKEEAQAGHNKWVGIMSSDTLPDKLIDCNNSNLASFASDLFGDDWDSEFKADF